MGSFGVFTVSCSAQEVAEVFVRDDKRGIGYGRGGGVSGLLL